MRKIYISKQNNFVLTMFVFLLTLVLVNINFASISYASMINSIQPQGPGGAVVPDLPETNINDPFHILDNHDFDNTNLIQRNQGEDEEHFKKRNAILGGHDTGVINIALESGGNNTRLIEMMKKAQVGGEYTIACYGGSITYGALLGHENERFGELVVSWFRKTFPKSRFNYINSGLGASNTEMGCYRIERDLLRFKPDFVIVDFAVNTSNVEDVYGTYSTILYKILTSEKKPAVCAINFTYALKDAVGYFPDINIPKSGLLRAQSEFNIPTLNYHKYVWQKIFAGEISWPDFNADYIHPNKYGHNIAASLIKAYLECIVPNDQIVIPPQPEPNYNRLVATSKFMNVGYITNEDQSVTTNEFMKKSSNIDCYHRGWEYKEGGEGEIIFSTPNQKRVGLMILFTSNAKGYLEVDSLDVGGQMYIDSEVSDVLKLFYINLAGEKFKLTTKLTQGSFKIFGICVNYEDS